MGASAWIQTDTNSGKQKRSAALSSNEQSSLEIRGLIRQLMINACTKCACIPTMLAALAYDVQVLNERTYVLCLVLLLAIVAADLVSYG